MPTAPNWSAALKAAGDFDISVSAYPEKHPESPDFATDIDMLKRKVDNGATRAITQFFFDNDLYERYVERVRRAGIYIPIVPGILPVHNFAQVANFSARCGALVPAWLAERFDGLDKDPQTHALVAAAVAAEQVLDLVERGVGDFHFYTMNRADLAFAICHMIGIRGDMEKARQPRQRRVGRRLTLPAAAVSAMQKGRANGPAFFEFLALPACGSLDASADQGRTPMMRAPIKAKAAQIIRALIGRVSPMV